MCLHSILARPTLILVLFLENSQACLQIFLFLRMIFKFMNFQKSKICKWCSIWNPTYLVKLFFIKIYKSWWIRIMFAFCWIYFFDNWIRFHRLISRWWWLYLLLLLLLLWITVWWHLNRQWSWRKDFRWRIMINSFNSFVWWWNWGLQP